MANVNRRTIQRAEAGKPVALETLSFVAEALGVPLSEIRNSNEQKEATMESTTTQFENELGSTTSDATTTNLDETSASGLGGFLKLASVFIGELIIYACTPSAIMGLSELI